jgi:hypothetical protein
MSSIAVDDLDNAVDCVVDGAVDDAVDDAVGDAVDNAVDNAVDGAVDGAVDNAVDIIDDAVDNMDDAVGTKMEEDDCPLASALLAEVASRFSRGHLCRIGLTETRLYCLLAAVRHCCRYSQLSRVHQAQITAVGELCGSILRGAGYVREKRELILSRAVGCGLDRQEVIAALIKYRKNPFTPTREARADFVLELRELYPAPAGRCLICAANR